MAASDDARPGTTSSPPLLEVSNRVVALHKRYYGKGPESTRVIFHGDTLVVILRGGFTRIERTLVDEGLEDQVLRQRRDLQAVMEERYVELVRTTLGREVEAFLSANHHDPDVQVEIFLLVPTDD
jgi:uncharacterized protein YbcI